MTHDEKLDELRAELARQDEILAETREAILAFGDVQLAVPAQLLDEPDAVCRSPVAVIPCALRA